MKTAPPPSPLASGDIYTQQCHFKAALRPRLMHQISPHNAEFKVSQDIHRKDLRQQKYDAEAEPDCDL